MFMPGEITIARYLKIAVDIAARIVSGDLAEGEKLKGRSVLSTEYNVSPETIRRAISLLADSRVVEVNIGAGITVLSREQAVRFVRSFRDDASLAEMNHALSQLFEQRRLLEEEIFATTRRIIDMYKYMRSDLINPVEIVIPADSHMVGQSIGQLQVWHHTGATIIGVVQESTVIISPGPYYEFAPNDSVLIVGDENVIERFNIYMRRNPKKL